MRKSYLLLLLLSGFSLSFYQCGSDSSSTYDPISAVSQEPAKEFLTVLASDVNLRSAPNDDTRDNIVGVAQIGEELEVIGKTAQAEDIGSLGTNYWYQVRWQGQAPWLFGGLTDKSVSGEYAGMTLADINLKFIREGLVNMYLFSCIEPGKVQAVVNELNVNDRQVLNSYLKKILRSDEMQQEAGAMQDQQDIQRGYENIQMQYGLDPSRGGNNSQMSASGYVMLWVIELYWCLDNQVTWEQTTSHQLRAYSSLAEGLLEDMPGLDGDLFGQQMGALLDYAKEEQQRSIKEQARILANLIR